MKLVSKAGRRYIQVAEFVWNKLSSSEPASDQISTQPVEPPEPIRAEVSVQGDTVLIEVLGYPTTIAFDDQGPDLEPFESCLNEGLERAFENTDAGRAQAPSWFKGFRDRKQIHEPVSAVIQACFDQHSPRSQPSDS